MTASHLTGNPGVSPHLNSSKLMVPEPSLSMSGNISKASFSEKPVKGIAGSIQLYRVDTLW